MFLGRLWSEVHYLLWSACSLFGVIGARWRAKFVAIKFLQFNQNL